MFKLLRYFSIASAVALIAVTFALVYLYRDTAMEGLVVSAEGQNITLARSFANILWPRFSDYVMTVSETDGEKLRARPETAEIDEAVRALTAGLPVLKVKIYNLDGRTIYSSQPSQIGADKSHNPSFLKSARAGKPASKFSFRENFSAFSGKVFNRSLVESYLPIWGDDDAIEGVFELYTDVTPLVAMIDRRTDRLTVGLLITFALLYGILFVIVRRADQILKRQYTDLLESEARFRAVVDNSPTKIHIKDADGRYTLVNPVAEKLFGFTDEEARGKTSYDIFPKEVADAFTAHDRAVAESGEMVEEMERFTVEDGVHTYLTVKFPIPDAQGGVAGVAAIGTDITERKQVEEELAKQSGLLKTTFESMSQGINVYDADLKLVAFNQRYVDLWRYPPGFIRLGMPFEEIARFKAERGDYGPGEVEALVTEWVVAMRQATPLQSEFTTPDGTVFVMWRAPMPGGGVINTFTDITERKKAEQALAEQSMLLETTFESISQGIVVYDKDLRVTAFNQKYVDLCGYPSGFVRLGMTIEKVIRFRAERGDYGPAADIDALVRDRARARRQGDVAKRESTGSDGTEVIVSRDTMPDGGYVTTFTDITEIKRVEEALRESEEHMHQHVIELEAAKRQYQAQGKELATLVEDLAVARDQAEGANRAKSDFLALMSHELRTPLNAIIGFSEIIKSEMMGPIGNPKYGEYASDVFDSGQHLLGLINDILDLSKIEAGKMELEEEDVDVAEVIGSCLRLVTERAAKGGVELITEVPDDLPALRIDERKLRQILLNLLSNAVKFTPDGGSVTVRSWFRSEDGFVLQVADTGIGIAPENIERALTPFGQVDSRLDRKYEGTGLGLPLTKSLIEKHGGSLDLQSKVGAGTTVTVRFPKERMVPRIEVSATGYPAA